MYAYPNRSFNQRPNDVDVSIYSSLGHRTKTSTNEQTINHIGSKRMPDMTIGEKIQR